MPVNVQARGKRHQLRVTHHLLPRLLTEPVLLTEPMSMLASQALGVSHASSKAPVPASEQPWCVTLSTSSIEPGWPRERRLWRERAVRSV